MINKNQQFEVTIESCTQEGYGICRIDGKAVFVAGALNGERWIIQILKVTNTAIWAKGLQLLCASSQRIQPDCDNPCGGCSLRHVSYDEELRIKLEHVNSCLQRIGAQKKTASIIHPSPAAYRYRNKAVFAVAEKHGKAAFGFYRPRSHDLVPIADCLLQSQNCIRVASAIVEFMNSHAIKAYDEATGKGVVRHIFWRESSSRAIVCIVAAKGFGADTKAMIDSVLQSCNCITGILLNINKTSGNVILSGDFYTLWGESELEEELCGLSFRISTRAFFQVNAPQAEQIYRKVLEYCHGASCVLDLYCGAGTISLCIAKTGITVTGVEIIPEAVENAKANAVRNRITNVDFVCADAAEINTENSFDVVVVDPPRKGLAESVIRDIVNLSPEKLIYVSCNPATLARDLAIFSKFNYELTEAEAYDMFPRTAHVETVCCLYHQKKDFISVPYEPKDADYMKQLK